MLFDTTKQDLKRPKYKGPFSMDYRERKSHAQGIYPTQYTLRMRTVRMKQKEETDTRMMQESIVRNQEERNLGMKE